MANLAKCCYCVERYFVKSEADVAVSSNSPGCL